MSPGDDHLHSFGRFVHLLALNTAYIVGPLLWGWNAGTLVVLFWFEVSFVAATVAVRIHRHRAHRPTRGHFRLLTFGRHPASAGSFLRSFVKYSTLGSVVYLFFLLNFVVGLSINGYEAWNVDFDHLVSGMVWVVAVELAQLVVDLFGIRNRSFAWVRAQADRAYGTIFLLQLVLFFGMIVLSSSGGAFLPFLVMLVLFKAGYEWMAVEIADNENPTPPLYLRWAGKIFKRDVKPFWDDWRFERMVLAEENEEIASFRLDD